MSWWTVLTKSLMAIFIVIIVFWLVHLIVHPVNAHEWYDNDCCNDNDCTPVERIERGDGYRIYHTKKFPPISLTDEEFYTRKREGFLFDIRTSKDMNTHICIDRDSYAAIHDDENEGYSIVEPTRVSEVLVCLYVPGTS